MTQADAIILLRADSDCRAIDAGRFQCRPNAMSFSDSSPVCGFVLSLLAVEAGDHISCRIVGRVPGGPVADQGVADAVRLFERVASEGFDGVENLACRRLGMFLLLGHS